MNKIPVNNIFAAVFDKSILDPLLDALRVQPSRGLNPQNLVKFWGTDGTVKYLISRGFSARSVVHGFDFDGRVKSLDRAIFTRILADRTNKKHLDELKKLAKITPGVGYNQKHLRGGRMDSSEVDNFEPFDLVIVDLYAPHKNNFPESMDIGGQALIRAAVKNFRNVAVAFDKKSINDVVSQIEKNDGSTSLKFRKKQAENALKFIADRGVIESKFEL